MQLYVACSCVFGPGSASHATCWRVRQLLSAAPPTPPAQHYDRDQFLFVFLILTIVAFSTSLQPVRTPLLLNRPQTEEWKGWMQVGRRRTRLL